MSAAGGQPMVSAQTSRTPAGWEAEVARLTEARHLAAWTDDGPARVAFGARVGAFWQGQAGVEVVRLFGENIRCIDDLCEQLERTIPAAGPLRRQIGGRSGIAARLRERPVFPGKSTTRTRYIIWHDTDTLIREDRQLFAAVIDAISGVAAETEFVCDDALLITRAVYLGGQGLAQLADDNEGPMRAWLHDGVAEPFWRVVSGIDRPPMLATDLDSVLEDPEALATELLLADLDLDGVVGM
ncbi:MAG: hypothetical protein AAFR96_03855 [Planctomycetota bacterium]